MQISSERYTAMFFSKYGSFLRIKLLVMLAMTLGFLQTPAMAQCSLNGGVITTAVTSPCILTSGTLTITGTGSITLSSGGGAAVQVPISSNVTGVNNTGTVTVNDNPVANAILVRGSLGNLTNSGQVTSGVNPSIANTGTINSFFNNTTGTISSTSSNAIYNISNTIVTLTNAGLISSTGSSSSLFNSGNITNLINSATGTINNTGSARAIFNSNTGTIGTLTNDGIISAGSTGQAIINTGSITSLGNTGTIAALDNLQGASSSALSYSGLLPRRYGIIIFSTTNYGKLAISNPGQSSLIFDIYGNTGTAASQTVPFSSLSAGTYRSVLTGLTSNNISSSSLNGTYPGGFFWQLVNSSGTTWDLVVTAAQANVVASASNININVNGTSTLSVSGGSGSGVVSFTLISGPCTLNGATLTGTGAGTCIVTATKAADGTYASATSSQITVSVTDISQIPTLSEWSLIFLASLMAMLAVVRLRRN